VLRGHQVGIVNCQGDGFTFAVQGMDLLDDLFFAF